MAVKELPKVPVAHDELVKHIAKHPEVPMVQLMEPYRKFEAHLREMYAQERNNPVLDDPYLNVLPLFTKDTSDIKVRARDLEKETQEEKDKYIMTLPSEKRRPNDSPATVTSLKEFKNNFGIFSESSLAEMDWSNVVAAGSSVVNTLLPVPDEYNKSKRALRQYYHEKFCPASDVDLFLYGLTEEQAVEKIKDIEARVRDAILSETTVVRTKNAITICSQYPTRHIQIVLRVYKSVSEILTGFDIDCSGAAFDGEQVYCTPRALASYITQVNPIDLSRRSPSYENRLSKYSHRNFEVYWSELDRSRIDPTIFERSFQRTLGLARLLVLERLPTTSAREQYLKKRRQERGRPDLGFRYQHRLRGNIKDFHEDEVADWVNEDEVSNYHTFTVPYGEKFHAKKIEKLCYTKDLLLNAEWNQPKERSVYLHRHPAFFGRVEDVIGDCCGACPQPTTQEELEVAEKESEIYLSGKVSFRIDDPGRQQIGSFNPLTEDDWTEMAYVGNTARLCQAIVDGDLEHVEDWLSQDGADPNKRDYTGRTPLHLAVLSSTPEIVKCLVDHGARITPRIADGQTALHLAAAKGDCQIVNILLEKSIANEEEEEDRQDQRRKAKRAALTGSQADSDAVGKETDDSDEESENDESDGELIDDDASDVDQSIATGSFVKVGKDAEDPKDDVIQLDDDETEPDFYKIDTVAWDSKCSPLHLAILNGHCDVVKILCQEFGADVLLPVKFGDGSFSDPPEVILTLVLTLALPVEKAVQMTETLLNLGATSSQADTEGVTAFHYYIRTGGQQLIQSLWENDKIGLKSALNHVSVTGTRWSSEATTPLITAIDRGDPILVLKLLDAGANTEIDFESWLKGAKLTFQENLGNYEANQKLYKSRVNQPLLVAIHSSNPAIAIDLLEKGVDPNIITRSSAYLITNAWNRRHEKGQSALDVVQDGLEKLRAYKGETVPFNLSFLGHEYMSLTANKMYLEAPQGLLGTSEFLEKFQEGTYQHWLVSGDIKGKSKAYQAGLTSFEKQRKQKESQDGMAKKKEAISDAISQLEKVEKALLARDAKTFKELYPDIEGPVNIDDSKVKPLPPYHLDFTFRGAKDVTDKRKAAYVDLFEAAWTGDLDTIKSLTLAPLADNEPPLQIAVSDPMSNNPFSLAVLRGHLSVAKAILEITQAQWAPNDEEKARYTMMKKDGDDSYDSDAVSDDEPEIHKEIIKDQLTIDNIGQISTQVKSHTLPTHLINWSVPTFKLLPDGKMKRSKKHDTLLAFAIAENDMEKFKFLVEVDMHYTSQKPAAAEGEDETMSKLYTFPDNCFRDAIKFGRTAMLADVIQRAGAGIPLEDLVQKSGVEMKVKPRYYQGLTVYGKKRADWANKGRNLALKSTGTKESPLLMSAVHGSLASVEWFLSDTPMRHYAEFGASRLAREDPRLKHLMQTRGGGFDRAIAKWLGVQNDLVLHCAVMGPTGEDTNRLVEYLLRVCPASLEARSTHGWTPLYVACLLGRVQIAETLIKAGADQSVKDKDANNLVHAALAEKPQTKTAVAALQKLLGLFDQALCVDMFCQRNTLAVGGDTPIHYWLKRANVDIYTPMGPNNDQYYIRYTAQPESSDNVRVLNALLELSGGDGDELDALNGAGDTILHSAVLRELPGQVRALLARRPSLLHRENAVGRTPAEIARDLGLDAVRGWLRLQHAHAVVINAPNRVEDLPTRDPAWFADEAHGCSNVGMVKRGASRREKVWEVVEEFLANGDAKTEKRRLVSLNEANDVARRIGESYTGLRYYQKIGGAEDGEEDEEERQQKQPPEEIDFAEARYDARKRTAWAEEKTHLCLDCGQHHTYYH